MLSASKSLFLLGSSAAALLIASPGFAQASATPTTSEEAAQAVDPNRTAEAAEAGDDGTIIVTGTRIRRPDYEFPSPIASFDAAAIQQSGRTNLTDFLTSSPALVGSSASFDNAGSNASIGFTGLNLLNLRNLGPDRTLVLIDGRRQVAAVPGSAAVDVNTIPTDLVERVDVVTGGASAVYGADGVSGVVNFILKRNFEGLSVRGQIGTADRGDSGTRFFSATAGKNFAGGRGNIAIAYEYNKDDRLEALERRRNRTENRITFQNNPDDPNDDPSLPDRVPLRDIRFYDSARSGGIDIDFDGLPDFLGDGSPFDPGRFVPPFFQQGGSGTPRADYIGDILPSNERHAVNGLFNFKLTDNINFFAQGKYVRTKSRSFSQPTFDFYLLIQPDNPFIPASLRQTAADNGGFLLSRDNFDLGSRGENITRETIRTVVGFDGDIGDHARFEASYVYGESTQVNRQLGNRFNDRFLAALDAVTGPNGQPTCRSNLDPTAVPDQPFGTQFPGFGSFTPGANSGCVPLNLFGEGVASQAAIDWVTLTSIARSKIKQQVLSGSISGDFGGLFELPGGAVSFALGAEYREERSRSTPDPNDTAGLTFGNVLFPSSGKFDVKEAFAELSVPLLKELPFAHELTAGAAVRLSDYSTVGRTTTWKIDGIYAPIRDLTFRGTIAEAVRAPNIGELFSPQDQTFLFIEDPCDVNNVNNGASTRADNCRALLTAAGVANPAAFLDPNSASIAGTAGGNPNLREETAKTYTAGIVLRPSFLPGFTASVDFYSIKLENAITTVTAQRLAELCVDQATIANQFCAAITRQQGGTTPGRITGFTLGPQNVADFRTRGVDFNVSYRVMPSADFGTLTFNVVGGYLDRLRFIGSPGAEPTIEQGQSTTTNGGESPRWIVSSNITWNSGPMTLSYGFNYYSPTLRFTRVQSSGDPDFVEDRYFKIKARKEHNLQLNYDVGENYSIYAGVNNLLDQKPDISSLAAPLIDPRGRFMYVGARVKLGRLF
jgi:outer membrane receptor protein involved in Fe transport